MAICTFAAKKLIPPGSNDPRIEARVAIWHVAVSMSASLFSFFRDRSGGIESHFYINWRGKLEQYRDTAYEADANYRANPFAVSIETAGWGIGRWNPLQRRAMQRLAIWLRDAEGIPLEKCTRWDGSGHGYHIQFGSPGYWTNVAKSCPGPQRIKQFNRWFVPWLNSVDNPPAPMPAEPTLSEEDDMPTPRELLDEPLNAHDPKGRGTTASVTVGEALTAFVEFVDNGPEAAQKYLDDARKSRA